MESALRSAVEAAISQATGTAAQLRSQAAAGGTSFDRAAVLTLEDGRTVFVKLAPASAADRFAGEAAGLAALAAPGILRVPRWAAAAVEAVSDQAFIVMPAISRGRASEGAWPALGNGLAEHHRACRGDRFGFAADNHCGATPQPNAWNRDGVAFWRHQRLGHQLERARASGLADRALSRAGDRLLGRLDELLDAAAEPCLIHGDLWSGNLIVDASDDDEARGPAVVDPAVYFGDREAELAMCHLFGGFPPSFFAAYEAAWPLPAGASERRPIFTLYHLLNHLNLFGIGYRSACMEILRRFA